MRPLTRTIAVAAAILVVLLAGTSAVQAAPDPPPAGANDFSCQPSADHPRPVVLVHGLGATMALNWAFVAPRLAEAGYCVFALTYGVDERTSWWPYSPGGVVPMETSAPELAGFVDRVLAASGADAVDLVGHSEGTVMPRYYLERLGGAADVHNFVALAPLWRGTGTRLLPALRSVLDPVGLSDPLVDLVASICGSCPQFLRGSDYLRELNADGEAVPGVRHTNIVTRYDQAVLPYTSGLMRDGGTNIVLQDVCPANTSEHVLLAFDRAVMQMILNALDGGTDAPIPC